MVLYRKTWSAACTGDDCRIAMECPGIPETNVGADVRQPGFGDEKVGRVPQDLASHSGGWPVARANERVLSRRV